MIFIDANILVSTILGKQTRRAFDDAIKRGLALGVTEAQLGEAAKVLIDKLGFTRDEVIMAMEGAARVLHVAPADSYSAQQDAARARLHDRAQPDWPVLAAALAAGGGIWSQDRDFFGVGAPVWSTRNLQFADSA